jgi:hypothetical protein
MNVSLPNAQTATHKINDRPKDKNNEGMGCGTYAWTGGASELVKTIHVEKL